MIGSPPCLVTYISLTPRYKVCLQAFFLKKLINKSEIAVRNTLVTWLIELQKRNTVAVGHICCFLKCSMLRISLLRFLLKTVVSFSKRLTSVHELTALHSASLVFWKHILEVAVVVAHVLSGLCSQRQHECWKCIQHSWQLWLLPELWGFYSCCCLWSNDWLPSELLLCNTAALVV